MTSDPRQPLEQNPPRDRWIAAGICIALVAIVWLVFGQAAGFQFVNYDDGENVFSNPHVTAGLGWRGIVWAFTNTQVGRWAPLTALSHMADCQLFGLDAGRHHLTNVAIHAITAVLLFIALRRMTGALWQSAFVAAVFAVHPLNAEPVTWVSARGDLLAGMFFMLTVLAYARHARMPGQRIASWSVAAFFALGLLCKPTIMMLPFALLLLDYWPLGRFTKSNNETAWLGIPRRLVIEKAPLFALAVLSAAAAALAQRTALTPIENLSFASRTGNALFSCVVYVRQFICPTGLAAFYPHPGAGLAWWQAGGALLLLVMASAAVLATRRRAGYSATGWFWHLVLLAPMLGIVEIGAQAHADRYAYLPQIGLCLLVAWGVATITAGWEGRREILGIGAGATIVLLVFFSHDQAATWRDSVTLWSNAVDRTAPNNFAENNLGSALLREQRTDEALVHLRKALDLDPGSADAHVGMGNALLAASRPDEAIAEYRRALDLRPDFIKALANLGYALAEKNLPYDAIFQYRRALDINPDLADVQSDLGEVLRRTGHLDEAIPHLERAVELNPGYAPARNNLGLVLLQMGRTDDAITQFQKAVDLDPGYESARQNLASALRQKSETGSGLR